jgi:hypothetical protein
MGWYTATKPFTRKLGDAVIRHKRGDRVFIDYREEAERLLHEKSVVKGKVKMKPLSNEVAAPNPDAEFKEIVRELAKETGLSYEACHAKVKRYTQPDQKTGRAMPVEEAVLRIRGEMSLLDDPEKIELLALDMGVTGAQANEQVAIAMERYECSINEAVAKIRYGMELQSEGQTEPEKPEEEPNEDEIVDGSESAPEGNKDDEVKLAEGVRVMAAYKGELRYGTVVKVCQTEVHVKLDKDDADYRRIQPDDIDIVTEEEQK